MDTPPFFAKHTIFMYKSQVCYIKVINFEVQRISGWENAVNSFRVDFDCDIYITGSNAYLLSSELSTYLSGRYIEIKVLPLSFKEQFPVGAGSSVSSGWTFRNAGCQ